MTTRLGFCASMLFAALAALVNLPAAAAPITISPSGFGFGPDYAQANLLVYPNCTRRTLRGAPGTLLTGANGGIDGFDCGLNLVVQIADPFTVDISGPGPQVIKFAEAALNERATITLGLFPPPLPAGSIPRLPGGDGQSLANLTVFALLEINGTTLRFDGTPSLYVGGPPASGNAALIAICDTPNHPNLQFTPQCVNDADLDFVIDFTAVGGNSVAIGNRLYTFAVDTLAFYNNNVVPINVIVTATDIDEPASLALTGLALAALAAAQRKPLVRRGTRRPTQPTAQADSTHPVIAR